MGKKQKMQMPQSTAGLVRYFDSSKEKIKLKPEHVVIICGAVIVIELLLKFGVLRI
jgi:preprotein translocase subunit Sec61beta